MRSTLRPISYYLLSQAGIALAEILPTPGQPLFVGTPGGFDIIGDSLVSAQQLFLGTADTAYFVDKVEGNPAQINGHPAWASEWGMSNNKQRAMEIVTNSFCAGGNVLGNGTWINVGGNQAVTYGGSAAESQDGTEGPYFNADGRKAIRLLTPCDDGTCQWVHSPVSSDQRWYPTVETLEDGRAIIIGGCKWGGYVNDAAQDNPTYEFFPPSGEAPIFSPTLSNTLPANLYPLTWLLPSGKLLMQSNWATVLLDYKAQQEIPLDDIPDAVRVYPASAGTVMLPLTPANNYTATVLFCGGSNISPERWLQSDFIPVTYPASTSCVHITPDVSGSYVRDDPLPEPRVMASFILLPDGKVLNINGARMGTAGYGNNSWAIGQSYADGPILRPALYNPDAPAGEKWSNEGFQDSTVPRLYHSAALLLADGSVLISGSNPNADYNIDVTYPTEYRTERFYPSYYNERRPEPQGLLRVIGYGGPTFDVVLSPDDLFGDVNNLKNTKVVIIRPGFSTHAMNMGQRYVQLASSYTGFQENNTATLHVNQLPPNPALLAPGPALIFVVVNGVPSIGMQVMIGSGQIGEQPILAVSDLPQPQIVASESGGADLSGTTTTTDSGSDSRTAPAGALIIPILFISFLALYS